MSRFFSLLVFSNNSDYFLFILINRAFFFQKRILQWKSCISVMRKSKCTSDMFQWIYWSSRFWLKVKKHLSNNILKIICQLWSQLPGSLVPKCYISVDLVSGWSIVVLFSSRLPPVYMSVLLSQLLLCLVGIKCCALAVHDDSQLRNTVRENHSFHAVITTSLGLICLSWSLLCYV